MNKSEIKKLRKKIESVTKLQMIDWEYFLQHPGEFSAKDIGFLKSVKPELYDELIKNVLKEMQERL